MKKMRHLKSQIIAILKETDGSKAVPVAQEASAHFLQVAQSAQRREYSYEDSK